MTEQELAAEEMVTEPVAAPTGTDDDLFSQATR